MRGRDQRPHLGLFRGGVAHLHAARCLDQELQKSIVNRLLHEDPRARAAVLARVVEDGVRRGRRRPLEVGVGEDDVCRLAAELERHPLDRRRRALHDDTADLRRACETDLPDVRMVDQPLSDDRALARKDVHDSFRKPRV